MNMKQQQQQQQKKNRCIFHFNIKVNQAMIAFELLAFGRKAMSEMNEKAAFE